MKRLLLLLALASGYTAHAAIALVTNKNCNGTSCTTAAANNTGATLFVVSVANYSSDACAVPVSDSSSNTWVHLTGYGNDAGASNRHICISYVKNPTVTSSQTISITGGVSAAGVTFASFSGTDLTSPLDQQNGIANSVTTTTVQPGSVTPAQNNELVYSAICSNNSSTSSIDSGMTKINSTATIMFADAYKVQTSAAAINPTWTMDQLDYSCSAIATFKVAAGVSKSNQLTLGVGPH